MLTNFEPFIILEKRIQDLILYLIFKYFLWIYDYYLGLFRWSISLYLHLLVYYSSLNISQILIKISKSFLWLIHQFLSSSLLNFQCFCCEWGTILFILGFWILRLQRIIIVGWWLASKLSFWHYSSGWGSRSRRGKFLILGWRVSL